MSLIVVFGQASIFEIVNDGVHPTNSQIILYVKNHILGHIMFNLNAWFWEKFNFNCSFHLGLYGRGKSQGISMVVARSRKPFNVRRVKKFE